MENVRLLGTELGINDWHCHHKNPYHLSKDDTYSNLIVLHEDSSPTCTSKRY